MMLLPTEATHCYTPVPSPWLSQSARVGPVLVALAGLRGAHLGRARLATVVQAVAFNIAVGNADAHARNYSVLLPPDGAPRLAPLYDVICTRYWPHLDSEAAQLVAGEDAIDKVSVEHLTREAARWGLTERLARSRVLKVLEAAAAHIDRAVEGDRKSTRLNSSH